MKSLMAKVKSIPAQAILVNNVMNAVYKTNPVLERSIKHSSQAKALLSIRHGGRIEKACALYFVANPEPTYLLPVCFVASMTMSIAKANRIGWIKSIAQDCAIDFVIGICNHKELGKPLDMDALQSAFKAQSIKGI